MMGVYAQVGQILMSKSLHLERANIVRSMIYIGIIFGIAYGYFFFGEHYDWNALAGIGLVVTVVLMNVFSKA